MRHRLALLVSVFVAAAHWWVLFAPESENRFQTLALQPNPTQRTEAVWVSLPLAKPSKVMPSPTPTAPHQHRKPAEPRTVLPAVAAALPHPATETSDASAPLIAEAEDTPSPQEVPAKSELAQTTAPATPFHAFGPSLQVRNSAGAEVAVELPIDGSALSQSMLLRFKVHGFVKGMEYHANAELHWHTEGNRYHARQSISAFLLGSMEQTSSGHLTPHGLQPLQFTDRRFTKRRSVQFDWSAQQATFDPEREAAPIGVGAQDRLSVFLQLATMLQAMPELRTPGTRIDIPTLGAKRLQMWTFVVEHTEALALQGGRMPTLRLQRLPQAGDNEKALLWVNPAQGYVPVRIRMEERNGDVMDLSLKS